MSPYDVLEVSSKATEEEVRAAYRVMAKKWHPDRKLDDQETATKKFMEISAAYRAVLRERRREAGRHSPSPSSSPQEKSNSASSNSDSPDDGHHSSRSRTRQKEEKDTAKSTRSSDRSENVDRSRHNSGRKEGESSSEKSSSERSRSSSRPSSSSSRPSSSSSRKSSSSSSSSASSSSRSSSKSSSYESGGSSENLSTASSRTSVQSSSTDSLPEQTQKRHREHYAQRPDTNDSTPSFTSYTSSEVSAYDNPEITPPEELRNEPCGERPKTTADGPNPKPTTPSPPARPPDEKTKSSRRKDPKMRKGEEEHEDRTLIPEYDSPLARAVGVSKEWTYTLRLTLDELFHGKKLRFRVVRCKLDGKRKTVVLDVNVPPGSVHGTQIIFRGAGHERKDGTRQDIVFIIEEAKHDRFVRVKEDLMLDVRLPWVEGLKKEPGVVYVKGIDGKESMFEVDFRKDGNVTGSAVFPGAGMPVPGTERRGKLVVRWEIYMPSTPSRWEAFKQALHL